MKEITPLPGNGLRRVPFARILTNGFNMLLKQLTFFVMVICGVVTALLDYYYHDKRTNKHRKLKKILILALIALPVLLSIQAIMEDRKVKLVVFIGRDGATTNRVHITTDLPIVMVPVARQPISTNWVSGWLPNTSLNIPVSFTLAPGSEALNGPNGILMLPADTPGVTYIAGSKSFIRQSIVDMKSKTIENIDYTDNDSTAISLAFLVRNIGKATAKGVKMTVRLQDRLNCKPAVEWRNGEDKYIGGWHTIKCAIKDSINPSHGEILPALTFFPSTNSIGQHPLACKESPYDPRSNVVGPSYVVTYTAESPDLVPIEIEVEADDVEPTYVNFLMAFDWQTELDPEEPYIALKHVFTNRSFDLEIH
jgi:hypothetical protein